MSRELRGSQPPTMHPPQPNPRRSKIGRGILPFYDVISKAVRWNRPRAEKQLEDLSDIALDYTLTVVKAKQSFTTGAKGENLPPTVFNADRDGIFDVRRRNHPTPWPRGQVRR